MYSSGQQHRVHYKKLSFLLCKYDFLNFRSIFRKKVTRCTVKMSNCHSNGLLEMFIYLQIITIFLKINIFMALLAANTLQ